MKKDHEVKETAEKEQDTLNQLNLGNKYVDFKWYMIQTNAQNNFINSKYRRAIIFSVLSWINSLAVLVLIIAILLNVLK